MITLSATFPMKTYMTDVYDRIWVQFRKSSIYGAGSGNQYEVFTGVKLAD